MTNQEAIQARLRPYELAEDTIQFLLEEQGLDASDEYSKDNQKLFYTAVVNGLWQLITLTEESDGGSKQKYDIDLIRDLIKKYQKQYGLEEDKEEKPVNIDITQYW